VLLDKKEVSQWLLNVIENRDHLWHLRANYEPGISPQPYGLGKTLHLIFLTCCHVFRKTGCEGQAKETRATHLSDTIPALWFIFQINIHNFSDLWGVALWFILQINLFVTTATCGALETIMMVSWPLCNRKCKGSCGLRVHLHTCRKRTASNTRPDEIRGSVKNVLQSIPSRWKMRQEWFGYMSKMLHCLTEEECTETLSKASQYAAVED